MLTILDSSPSSNTFYLCRSADFCLSSQMWHKESTTGKLVDAAASDRDNQALSPWSSSLTQSTTSVSGTARIYSQFILLSAGSDKPQIEAACDPTTYQGSYHHCIQVTATPQIPSLESLGSDASSVSPPPQVTSRVLSVTQRDLGGSSSGGAGCQDVEIGADTNITLYHIRPAPTKDWYGCRDSPWVSPSNT
ncbi:hypothetical protein JAAARDRAFT_200084 [Jaapia argillacea MUCL 33604]|uniref:Uncharacterized protein n=1 Tax=Jaapia argillacea MUCL 33604 TaxID=933084 RepID=A0A067P692_9AGAM|nr:hypothetical protein JAAARDRAFT_200084 [Jaapia argillacea MUCL 33604]